MTAFKRPKPVHQMTVGQFEKAFPDEEACEAYLVARRWPNGVRCPRCGNTEVTEVPGGYRWQCYKCAPQTSYRFSHIAGTIGSFHKVSRKYMRLYVAEFQFRYNNRFNANIFATAIEGC
jgi:transposase-like protein